MLHAIPMPTTMLPPVSPLLLSHQLITLAEQADEAGYAETARRLVALAHTVLDEPTN